MIGRTIGAAAILCIAGHAAAQSFPSKPIRFITVATASTDIVTRIRVFCGLSVCGVRAD